MPHHIWAEKPVARRRSGFRFTAGDGLLVAWLRGDLTAPSDGLPRRLLAQASLLVGNPRVGGELPDLLAGARRAGADVILNGHDHDYERFAPQDPTGEPDSTGARKFVVGTGGKDLRGFATDEPSSEVRNSDIRDSAPHPGGGLRSMELPPGRRAGFTDDGSATCSPLITP